MRRATLLALLSLAIAAIVFFTARNSKLKAQTSLRKPFTATIIVHRYANGVTSAAWPDTELVTYAVRSDGSTAEVKRRLDPNRNWIEEKAITDAQSAKRVSVDPMTRSLTTYSVPRAAFSASSSGCTSNATAEHSTMLGYDVVKVSEVPVVTGVPNSYTAWEAPALNCFPLYESASPTLDPNGPTHNTRQVAFLTEGEPAPALFSIPSNYTERSPSEVMAEFGRLFPAQSHVDATATSMLDSVYTENH